MDFKISNINQYIEHTKLNPKTTENDIIQICNEAIKFSFWGVVTPPIFVHQAVELLKDENIKVISVCDFPLGLKSTNKKIKEVVKLANYGVNEIDMVANLEQLKNNNYGYVSKEIEFVRNELPKNIMLKVIIEAGLLTDSQIVDSVQAVVDGCADYVKTSTGTNKNTTLAQFKFMTKAANFRIKLKASGGISNFTDCSNFIEAGADRIGTSSAVSIMNEFISQRKINKY